MFLKNLDLTTALRPSYLPDEVLLFVQDNVGLYQGYVWQSKAVSQIYHTRDYQLTCNANCRKFKIPDYQNGQVYLTSHRICYVDNAQPRKYSTAIELKDVERYEFYVCLTFTDK